MHATTLVCIVLLLISTNFIVLCSEQKPHKGLVGAVVALLKGDKKSDFDELIIRNKSLLKYMWSNVTQNPDVVLFYEGELPMDVRTYIQEQTPELHMKYVPVQFSGFGLFEDADNTTAKQVNPQCIPTFWSKQFKIGYRNMCRFWFIGLFQYVQEYDWIFRLDPDCELLDYITDLMPNNVMGGVLPFLKPSTPGTEPADGGTQHLSRKQIYNQRLQHVFISSPGWLPLHRQKFDKVATTRDGDVVFGLGGFVRDFANRHHLNHSFIDSMNAPYTNAMFINLRWLRSDGAHSSSSSGQSMVSGSSSVSGGSNTNSGGVPRKLSQPAIIRAFLREVDESNCIYSNRWGDMPLWGAALSLVEHTVRFLNVPYYHASHNVVIRGTSRTGFFRADIPHMLIYADNQNSTLNTRISVHGEIVTKQQQPQAARRR